MNRDEPSSGELLVLHVMYEHQHLAGKESLSQAEIEMHYADELFEHGTPDAAVNAIRARCGLAPRR